MAKTSSIVWRWRFAAVFLAILLVLSAVRSPAQDQKDAQAEIRKALDVVTSYVDSRRADAKDRKVMSRRELLLIKRDAARSVLREMLLRFENERFTPERIDIIMGLHRRVMEADVALGEKKADRIGAIKAYMNAVSECGQVVKARMQVDASPGDLMRVGLALADAELLLLEAEKE
ncbi:MAG: hypothetical protein WD768_11170 [Phycisphaeraceae bacterium]